MTFEDMPEDEREFYLAADITQGRAMPWDYSRAWKLLVVLRDVALLQETPDWERVTVYVRVIDDLATMIQALGYPIPPVQQGDSPSKLHAYAEYVLNRVRAGETEIEIPEEFRADEVEAEPEPGPEPESDDPFEPSQRRSSYRWPDPESGEPGYVSKVPEDYRPAKYEGPLDTEPADDEDDNIVDLTNWNEES